MKKRYVFVGGTILVILVAVCVVFFVTQAKEDKDNDNKGKKESTEVTAEPPLENDEDGKAKELNTDTKTVTFLVNKEVKLEDGYKPENLVTPNVTLNVAKGSEKSLMRKEAAEALEKMFSAAKKDGKELVGVSAYRSYETQKALYANYLKNRGEEWVSKYSARPGTSEHQTGLGIDIFNKGDSQLSETFAETPGGKWISEHAHEYGFVIRYQKDKVDKTGYAYEPWHIRYLGVELAKILHEKNWCLEEYYDFEMDKEKIAKEEADYNKEVLAGQHSISDKAREEADSEIDINQNQNATNEQNADNGVVLQDGESAGGTRRNEVNNRENIADNNNNSDNNNNDMDNLRENFMKKGHDISNKAKEKSQIEEK